jgi:hypothetical protein
MRVILVRFVALAAVVASLVVPTVALAEHGDGDRGREPELRHHADVTTQPMVVAPARVDDEDIDEVEVEIDDD